MGGPSYELTQQLREWARGNSKALDRVAPALYRELRRLAAHYLRGERPEHTLQPTALIGEAFVRLMKEDARDWQSRGHFVAIAARCMRRILVEHARARRRLKRSTGQKTIAFDDSLFAPERTADLVALDDALRDLAGADPRKAEVVELTYFGGMAQAEIAALLGVHANTVARDLRLGEAWLRRRILDPD
jgi:RNA polymerase sigma-70 factor, ECF subfamily